MTTATLANRRKRMNPILKVVIYLACACAIVAVLGLIGWGSSTLIGMGVKAAFQALSWAPFWQPGLSNLWVGILAGSSFGFLMTAFLTLLKALHATQLWVKHLGD